MEDVDLPATRTPALSELDAAAVRRWYDATLAAWTMHRRTIDALNVFPVPDGDTGTNLAATMRAACDAMGEADTAEVLPSVTHGAARGALLGARGNSGVIVAQMLRGLADTWGAEKIDSARLASGLRAASSAAMDAVAAPAEGTILTVARAAAETAERYAMDPLEHSCVAVSSTAAAALAGTVDQLPALARAGVVDAGGLGLAVMLDSLATVVTGQATEVGLHAAGAASRTARLRTATEVPRESGSEDYAYEVQYLLDTDTDAVERLRTVLAGLGDSLVIVGGSTEASGEPVHTWNVHVHVNDVGAAVEAGIELGRVHRLSVTRFADQQPAFTPAGMSQSARAAADARGVVVLAEGSGIASVLRGEGAGVITTAHPSTAEILSGIRSSGTGDVIVLPGEENHAVTESAAELARVDGYRVAVVPTRSPVQALAALAVRDTARRFDDDVIAMAEAAGACRNAEITVAARQALTSVGTCEPGDYLGLVDGEVVLIGVDLSGLLRDLADRLCASGAELMTVVRGAGMPEDASKQLSAYVAERWPFAEVQCLDGGQSRHLVWIGAE